MGIEHTGRCDICNAMELIRDQKVTPPGWITVAVHVADKHMHLLVCDSCALRNTVISSPVSQLTDTVKDYLRNQRKLRADAAALKKKK